MMLDNSLDEMAVKVGLFLLVQALVYCILSSSSSVFSNNKMRSLSFKPARSVSIRRFMAALSDLPAGGEPSPLSKGPSSPHFLDERFLAKED
ncbi:hypothetical protein ACHQM5_012398 [Ranunculus cassubicifolius]